MKVQQPALMNRKGPILLNDNARPHVASITVQKLLQLDINVLPHSPYSSDLSPTDFHFFCSLNSFLAQKRFGKQEDIKNAFQQFLSLRDSDFYIRGINALVIRWQKCIEHYESYFK
ncbi:Histone-lysine N-methyltransferase SETMAR [Habropoda laboriosa]|uniref:Histone-lysine N-methyltransferase SETMAR n=1 Tax=Habropoda laboriosa TaxID=597456 RepID=A0A0L7QYV5_9HYME|nr:Histone-lysine N-methyltransferase SETMAR [Habropoda laboriosa]